MSKYPCGICTIGVKHKGILCTGDCGKWYHSKCLNWTDKQFKTLSKNEIESWQCLGCYSKVKVKINESSQIPITLKENTPSIPTIEEINSKLLNYNNMEDIDLETSLTLAAEVGNTLLLENNSLKEKINKLTLTNSNLALKVKNLEKQNLTYLEEQIEGLLTEKQILTNTNNTLVERLNEAEQQLIKEKHFRNELVSNFEEHDIDKENTIKTLEKDNQSLQKVIKCLKHELLTKQSSNTKHYKNMETQTEGLPSEENEYNKNSSLIRILTEIQIKQENMELSLKPLIDYVSQQNLQNNVKTPIIPKTDKNPCIYNKHKNSSAKSSKGKCKQTAYKNNMYSVSLQVAKCQQRTISTVEDMTIDLSKNETPQTAITSPPISRNESHTLTRPSNAGFKTVKSPPMNARVRPDNEDLQDFFNKHIDFYIQISHHHFHKSANLQINCAHGPTPIGNPTNPSPQVNNCFLDNNQQGKVIL